MILCIYCNKEIGKKQTWYELICPEGHQKYCHTKCWKIYTKSLINKLQNILKENNQIYYKCHVDNCSYSMNIKEIVAGKFVKNISTASKDKVFLCLICYSNFADILFDGCRHRACINCVNQMRKASITSSNIGTYCPFCRNCIIPEFRNLKIENKEEKYEIQEYEAPKKVVEKPIIKQDDSGWKTVPKRGIKEEKIVDVMKRPIEVNRSFVEDSLPGRIGYITKKDDEEWMEVKQRKYFKVCDICEREFTEKNEFTKHMKKIH